MSSAPAFLLTPAPRPSPIRKRITPPSHHRLLFAARCCPTSCASIQASPQNRLQTRKQQLHFLQNVWGKQPLLIRNFLPECATLLSREQVLDLAAHPTCPSRLIETLAVGATPPYALTLGPLDRAGIAELPPRDWTVLVQGVDRLAPSIADLLDAVAFLPNWRLDDIQLSYATRGGGVGPHVDNYDVFLVQGHGRRRWKVSNTPIPPASEIIVEDCDVRVLRHAFQPDGDWVLHPGDALYVPPRFPHHGVCESDDCSTFSIGFRAPTTAHLLASWLEQLITDDELGSTFFKDDPEDLVRCAGDRGRISATAVNRAYGLLQAALRDDTHVRRRFVDWFSAEVSQQKVVVDDDDYGEDQMSMDEVDSLLDFRAGSVDAVGKKDDWSAMRHREGCVFAYYEHDVEDVALYVDGHMWEVKHVDIAKHLCNERRITPTQYAEMAYRFPSLRTVVRELLLQGYLYFER